MSTWGHIRSAGWLVVGAFLVLEGSSQLALLASRSFPGGNAWVTLTDENEVHSGWVEESRLSDGRIEYTLRSAGPGEPPGSRTSTPDAALHRAERATAHSYLVRADRRYRLGSPAGVPLDGPYLERLGWALLPLKWFNAWQRKATGFARPATSSGTKVIVNQWGMEDWTQTAGRIVFRGDDGAIAAVLGAAGAVRTPGSAAVAPLPELMPFCGAMASARATQFTGDPPPETLHSFGITPSGDVFCLSIERPEGDGSPRPATPIGATLRPVGPRDRPAEPLLLRSGSARVTHDGVLMRSGDRLLIVYADGRVETVTEIDAANETVIHAGVTPVGADPGAGPGADWAKIETVSLVGPWEPCRTRVRLRRIVKGKPPIVGDGEFLAVQAEDYATTTVRVAAGLVRPPFLNAAASVGRPPATYGEMVDSWWLDPLFTGSRGGACLAVSLLIGALSGVLALRDARRRVPGRAWIWAGIAALLGPLGLAWMHIVVRREALKPCTSCGSRRAVDLATCSRCHAAWPAPDPRVVAVVG